LAERTQLTDPRHEIIRHPSGEENVGRAIFALTQAEERDSSAQSVIIQTGFVWQI
jgi:hypothetical protein